VKATAFIRVAKSNGHKGYRVDASTRPNYSPIKSDTYRHGHDLPTVLLAVTLNIPDEAFEAIPTEVELSRESVRALVEVQAGSVPTPPEV
jgi:hypothetical protein